MRSRIGPLLVAVCFVACVGDSSGPGQTQNVGVAGDGQLAPVLELVRANFGLPSLGALMLYEGQVVESAAVGLRAVGGGAEVTAADRWHLGSLTKAMTATLAAVLVEGGVLSWDTTVSELFPGMVGTIRSEYHDVRLDELLYHTSGLPADETQTPIYSTLRDSPSPLPEQRRQWAEELLSLEPEAARGTFHFSDGGYVVAGAMIEQVTGSAWEELMQSELFDALGMTSAGFGPPGSTGAVDEPRGHASDGETWHPIEPGPVADNPAAIGPAGTVHASMADYARFMEAHLAGARGVDGIVSAATFDKLQTPASGSDYALGWGVGERDWAGGTVLQHAGSNTLWYAVVWLAPVNDIGLLAVTNAGGDVSAIATDNAIVILIERLEAALEAGGF